MSQFKGDVEKMEKPAFADMPYWRAVVGEVLNRRDPLYPMRFTNARNDEALSYQAEQKKRKDRRRKRGEVLGLAEKKAYSICCDGISIILTRREFELLDLYSRGCTSREAAESMGVGLRTVEYYTRNVCTKLSCSNKKDLVLRLQSM